MIKSYYLISVYILTCLEEKTSVIYKISFKANYYKCNSVICLSSVIKLSNLTFNYIN